MLFFVVQTNTKFGNFRLLSGGKHGVLETILDSDPFFQSGYFQGYGLDPGGADGYGRRVLHV